MVDKITRFIKGLSKLMKVYLVGNIWGQSLKVISMDACHLLLGRP